MGAGGAPARPGLLFGHSGDGFRAFRFLTGPCRFCEEPCSRACGTAMVHDAVCASVLTAQPGCWKRQSVLRACRVQAAIGPCAARERVPNRDICACYAVRFRYQTRTPPNFGRPQAKATLVCRKPFPSWHGFAFGPPN